MYKKKTQKNKKKIRNDIGKIEQKSSYCIESNFTMQNNKLINFFNQKRYDIDIHFESFLLKEIVPKYLNIDKIKILDNPKFIKLKNIKLVVNENIFNKYIFSKIRQIGSNTIEPIFIDNPKIMEIYYNNLNIQFEYIDEKDIISDKYLIYFIYSEKNKILKNKLQYLKDEINFM